MRRIQIVDYAPRQRQIRDQIFPHHLQYDESAQVLQTLRVLKPRYGMQQLHANWADCWASVQKKQIPAAPRVLHGVLDELHDRLRLELRTASETKITCQKKRSFEINCNCYYLSTYPDRVLF